MGSARSVARVVAAGAVVVVVGMVCGPFVIRCYAGSAGWERAALIGNVVDGVGSVFSALAVLAALAAVYLQAIALEEQRHELRAAQEDQAKQAATMRRSIELQALSALVAAHAAWATIGAQAKGGGPAAPYTTAFGELNKLIARLEHALGDQAPPSSATSTPAESAK